MATLLDALQGGGGCTKTLEGECIPLGGTDCFGAPLDYTHTSIELVTDSNTLKQARDKLLLWSGLKSVPHCWKVIQPLLCSLYFPKCENGTISLPDRSLCLNTRSPCKIVEIENGWPDFMVCDNDDVFADNCPNAFKIEQFNISECEAPLMPTSNQGSWYENVEGCGLQCMNPLFNQEEHDDMHTYIAVWASITTVCTLFAMLSFFIDWKNSSKYPARIIFYINVCFFLCSFGWLAQFFQDARMEIVCRKDGTVRLGEPVGHEESPSCVIIFVFVYFFVMAGVAWFVVLSYSWKAMFKALGTSEEPLKGKTLRFHLFVWSVAFILLIASLAVSQVDGDSMSGICFIGYKNHWYRMGFLLVPIGLMLLAGGYYLFGGLHSLLSLKQGHDGLLSESAVSKITWTMIRIGVFALFAFTFVLLTFSCHVYEIMNQPLWTRSFKDFIRCDANITILEKLQEEIDDPAAPDAGGCVIAHRPNIAVMKGREACYKPSKTQGITHSPLWYCCLSLSFMAYITVHLFAMFGTGIIMSTWVWTKASFMNWRRAWFKLIGRSDNEMKRIRHRSRMIAKAFANRHKIGKRRAKEPGDGTNNAGFDPAELAFSSHTLTHQDPVGMDFDLNSVSQELSSSWVRNVPQMVRRRGAIMPQPVSSDSPSVTPQPREESAVWAKEKSKIARKSRGEKATKRDLKRVEVDTGDYTDESLPVRRKLPPIQGRTPGIPPLKDSRISTHRTQVFAFPGATNQPGLITEEDVGGQQRDESSMYNITDHSALSPFAVESPETMATLAPAPYTTTTSFSEPGQDSVNQSTPYTRRPLYSASEPRQSKHTTVMRMAW